MKRVALILVVLLALTGSTAWAGISVEMEAVNPFLTARDNVTVRVSMTNTGNRTVHLLKWHTPFDGVEEDIFDIARDGQKVRYLGPHVKRPAPTPRDYIRLQPGQTKTATVELSAVYDLTVTGAYDIRYQANPYSLFHSRDWVRFSQASGKRGGRIESVGTTIWMEGQDPNSAEFSQAKKGGGGKPGGGTVVVDGVTYTDCDNSRIAKIQDAIVQATNIASESYSYLVGGSSSSQRYAEWFGAYSSGRWNTVEGNFRDIRDAFQNESLAFDCGCKQRYYAYVYSNDPYTIYLCRVFWNAPLTGTDSKAGTLVHEMSHFNVVAGTDDVVYGQSGCRNLADSDPNQAIQNADSHEYFAENTPYLP